MYDFKAKHVGKERYRGKKQEEDLEITNELTNKRILLSLKAYGHGFLQLSTDKHGNMFQRLSEQIGKRACSDATTIKAVWKNPVFRSFANLNALALIYEENYEGTRNRFKIQVFDTKKAGKAISKIKYIPKGKNRKFPVYRFLDSDGCYICEVRYGQKDANALQRGFWTHTRNAGTFFDCLTDGWFEYSHNEVLVELFSHALVATSKGHREALERLRLDIQEQRRATNPCNQPPQEQSDSGLLST
jgi:hypothetical protein